MMITMMTMMTNASGFCVILIGPKDGQRHCEPEPRYLEEECNDAWRLHVSITCLKSLQKLTLGGGLQCTIGLGPLKVSNLDLITLPLILREYVTFTF